MVAFANSVAPDDTAIIFIGEKDDGAVQGATNIENIQKAVTREAEKIYPEIYFRTEVYERDGKQCVRVNIKHNGLAPHFGGPAWVRRGSQTIKATEQLYQQMLEQRQGKLRVLLQCLNRDITVEGTEPPPMLSMRNEPFAFLSKEWSVGTHHATLAAVNTHWVTFSVHITQTDRAERSEPMEKLWLSWDDERKRLKVSDGAVIVALLLAVGVLWWIKENRSSFVVFSYLATKALFCLAVIVIGIYCLMRLL